MSTDGTTADDERVAASAGGTLLSPSGRGTGAGKGDGKGGDETSMAAERESSAGCSSSEAYSYLDHRNPHRPPNPEEPWLPLQDRLEDLDNPKKPAYTPPWLPPPEPALLPPPPAPLAPRDPSTINKPSVSWRQQIHVAAQAQATPVAVSSENAGGGGPPPLALGSMMYPVPRVGVAMHMPSWPQAPPAWYPHPAMAAAAGPSPQHHYLHQSLYRHDHYAHHNQHPFMQAPAGHLYSGAGPSICGIGGVGYAPISDGATAVVAGVGGSGIGVAANGGGMLSAPAPAAVAAAAAANTAVTDTAAAHTAINTVAGGAERANQWPPPSAQPHGGRATTTAQAPARRAGKRARVHPPPGAAAALIKGLLSMPVTKSSARWTEETVHGRPLRGSEAVVPLARGSPPPAFSAKPENGHATASVASSTGGAAAAATAMVAAAEAAAVPTVGGVQTSMTTGDPKANFRPAVWALGFDSQHVVAEPQPPLPGSSDHNKRGDNNHALSSPALCQAGTVPQQWRGNSMTDTSELLASLLVENDTTSRKASALGDATMRSLSVPPGFPAV